MKHLSSIGLAILLGGTALPLFAADCSTMEPVGYCTEQRTVSHYFWDRTNHYIYRHKLAKRTGDVMERCIDTNISYISMGDACLNAQSDFCSRRKPSTTPHITSTARTWTAGPSCS